MCLLRQTTGRVLFITLALVAALVEPPLVNCLDDRHLALHHHWHIDDSVDETHQDTLLANDLDHSRCFFHDLWYGDVDSLLHGALLNAFMWDLSRNFSDLLHDLRNVLNRHLRLDVWTQLSKITVLTYINQFLSRHLPSNVYPHSRTRSSPCSLCPGRTALHLMSLDFRRCADDGKFILQLGLQLTYVHPSLLAGKTENCFV